MRVTLAAAGVHGSWLQFGHMRPFETRYGVILPATRSSVD